MVIRNREPKPSWSRFFYNESCPHCGSFEASFQNASNKKAQIIRRYSGGLTIKYWCPDCCFSWAVHYEITRVVDVEGVVIRNVNLEEDTRKPLEEHVLQKKSDKKNRW